MLRGFEDEPGLCTRAAATGGSRWLVAWFHLTDKPRQSWLIAVGWMIPDLPPSKLHWREEREIVAIDLSI